MLTFNHFNFNVSDLERSIQFYRDALGLEEVRRKEAEDGSFVLEMGCVCYENPSMGIYFISDPDGYWIEIIPDR